MYTQARFFIKTALIYLVIAFVVGGIVLANQGLNFSSGVGALLYPYYHLLVVGWITQLICGVALWMFPVISRENPRGDERWGWATYGLLNAGLILRVIFEPIHTWYGTFGWMLVVSAILQMLAIWCFIVAIWSRVKQRVAPKKGKGA